MKSVQSFRWSGGTVQPTTPFFCVTQDVCEATAHPGGQPSATSICATPCAFLGAPRTNSSLWEKAKDPRAVPSIEVQANGGWLNVPIFTLGISDVAAPPMPKNVR